MTQDEVREILNTLMEAVSRVFDAKALCTVKSEIGLVRLIDNDDIYVRPSSDVSTPLYATPVSVEQLDDGDIKIPNISGNALEVGDGVEIHYTGNIADAVIVRKLIYSPATPPSGGADPYNASPEMDGIASPGSLVKYARGDHVHPSDTNKANVNSPILTGIPQAPTASAGTNTKQIATTEFVTTALSSVNTVPSGGQTDQVLMKTANGYEWRSLPVYDGSVT